MLWLLRLLLALVYFAASAATIAGLASIEAEFSAVGFGEGYKFFVVVLQTAGAALILTRRAPRSGAALLALVSLQGVLIHLLVLHRDVVPAVVLLTLCLIAMLPGRKPAEPGLNTSTGLSK